MMLKEKSNKWARLKLLLLLPLGTLTVFAFARPETENVMDSFRVDEVTKNISDESSIRDTNDGIINTYVDGKLVATHSLNRNVIGKESFGKFNIIHTTDARDNITTIFPYEFASKENPRKADFLKIKEYVSAGKQYTTNDFLNKYKGCILFLERSKVEDGYNQVSEVYGVLADGSKTPVFYMTMMDTKAASDSVPPKTIKFTPPHTKKSSGKSSSKTPPPPPPIKKNSQKIVKDEWPDLSSYKVGDTFTDVKGREWEVTSIDPPEMKLKSSSLQATVKISKKGYKYVGSIVRDTVPPPPPPIKADQTKKDKDGK